MKLPPEFDSAIKFYHYMNDHINIDLSDAPDNLILKYQFKIPLSPQDTSKVEMTVGELRAACWKEIADIEIRPEVVYRVEAALNERYTFHGSNKVTELLYKIVKL